MADAPDLSLVNPPFIEVSASFTKFRFNPVNIGRNRLFAIFPKLSGVLQKCHNFSGSFHYVSFRCSCRFGTLKRPCFKVFHAVMPFIKQAEADLDNMARTLSDSSTVKVSTVVLEGTPYEGISRAA
jgi:hypothetical protein